MWNLEKWYRWTGLQDRNWDRCREQTYGHQVGKAAGGGGGCDELGGWDWHVYTDVYKMITNKNLLYKKIIIQVIQWWNDPVDCMTDLTNNRVMWVTKRSVSHFIYRKFLNSKNYSEDWSWSYLAYLVNLDLFLTNHKPV